MAVNPSDPFGLYASAGAPRAAAVNPSDPFGLFGEPAAASGQGVIGNVVDTLQHGALQGVGGALDFVGADGAARYFYDKAQSQRETMSPDWAAAMEGELFSEEGDYYLGKDVGDPQVWVAKGLDVLGMMAVPVPGGAAATAVARTALGLSKAAKALSAAKNIPLDEAQQIIAKSQPWRDWAATTIGYGGAEGVVGAGLQEKQVREQILAMPFEKLADAPLFQEALAETGDAEAARTRVADDLSKEAAWRTFGPTAVLGAGAGRVYDDLLHGMGQGSRLANMGRGALTEAAEEAPQSAFETLAANAAMRQVDPAVGLGDNLVPSMLEGAALGGASGGVIGGMMPRGEPREPTGDERAKAALDKLGQAPTVDDALAAFAEAASAPVDLPALPAPVVTVTPGGEAITSGQMGALEAAALGEKQRRADLGLTPDIERILGQRGDAGVDNAMAAAFRQALGSREPPPPPPPGGGMPPVELGLPAFDPETGEILAPVATDEAFGVDDLQFHALMAAEREQSRAAPPPVPLVGLSHPRQIGDRDDQAPPPSGAFDFKPTHKSASGEPLMATEQPGVFLARDGVEVEDAYAAPMASAAAQPARALDEVLPEVLEPQAPEWAALRESGADDKALAQALARRFGAEGREGDGWFATGTRRVAIGKGSPILRVGGKAYSGSELIGKAREVLGVPVVPVGAAPAVDAGNAGAQVPAVAAATEASAPLAAKYDHFEVVDKNGSPAPGEADGVSAQEASGASGGGNAAHSKRIAQDGEVGVEASPARAQTQETAREAAVRWLREHVTSGTDGANTFNVGQPPFAKRGEIQVNGMFSFKVADLAGPVKAPVAREPAPAETARTNPATIKQQSSTQAAEAEGESADSRADKTSDSKQQAAGKKPLRRIRIEREYQVEETGETVRIEERADVMLARIDERLRGLAALRKCVAG